MDKTTEERLFTLLASLLGIATIVLQIYPPQRAEDKQTSIILFLGLVVYIIFIYVYAWIGGRIKSYTAQVHENMRNIAEIRKMVADERRNHQIDKCLSVLEALQKNRRGADYILWAMMVVLLVIFYLYLRAKGIVP